MQRFSEVLAAPRFCLRLLLAVAIAAWCGCDSLPWAAAPANNTPGSAASASALPVAARNLPEHTRLTLADLALRELSPEEIEELPLEQVMASRENLVGRVNKRAIAQGRPFIIRDLYLEGLEPGASPEPASTAEPAWPPLKELRFISTEIPPNVSNPTILVPLASDDLPVGRRLRKSDISLVPMTIEQYRVRFVDRESEVLTAPGQFIGRRLLSRKSRLQPFLVTDFERNDEISGRVTSRRP